MDNLAGIAAALVAMSSGDDGHRPETRLMLSALPDAPTITHPPTFRERLLSVLRKRETRRAEPRASDM